MINTKDKNRLYLTEFLAKQELNTLYAKEIVTDLLQKKIVIRFCNNYKHHDNSIVIKARHGKLAPSRFNCNGETIPTYLYNSEHFKKGSIVYVQLNFENQENDEFYNCQVQETELETSQDSKEHSSILITEHILQSQQNFLSTQINKALDLNDKKAFMQLTNELNEVDSQLFLLNKK